MISPAHYLILGAILFAIGIAGLLVRRNILVMLMSIELMLNAVDINFATFARMWNAVEGQVFVVFVLGISAAQAAVGIGIVLAFFRKWSTTNADEMDLLKW